MPADPAKTPQDVAEVAAEDASIRRQEQIDAAQNGGVLTGQQYSQLSQEESALMNQINQDHK